MDDLTIGDYLPTTVELAEGVTLYNVHPRAFCQGRGCVIHAPSEHRMKNWPKDFDLETRHFNRFCAHRVAHPDPDDVAYFSTYLYRDISGHDCDGCCVVVR
jgi:hypothetical protein